MARTCSHILRLSFLLFFFFNDTATTEIYTLSLHDALPICKEWCYETLLEGSCGANPARSEEHTSELQSLRHLVCRLLLEKKKKTRHNQHHCTRRRSDPPVYDPSSDC